MAAILGETKAKRTSFDFRNIHKEDEEGEEEINMEDMVSPSKEVTKRKVDKMMPPPPKSNSSSRRGSDNSVDSKDNVSFPNREKKRSHFNPEKPAPTSFVPINSKENKKIQQTNIENPQEKRKEEDEDEEDLFEDFVEA